MSLERLAAPGAGHNHASHIPRKTGYHCFVCRIEGPGARAIVTISPGTFYQRGSWKASWLWCSTIFTLAKVAEVTKAEKTMAWDVVCKHLHQVHHQTLLSKGTGHLDTPCHLGSLFSSPRWRANRLRPGES